MNNKRERDNRPWIIAGITVTVFAISLAFAIVQRMSNEAVAVLAGAFCGVAASIPTSLLIVWTTTRERYRRQQQPPAYPPIIVQTPPALTDRAGWPRTTVEHVPTREFQVVGDE
ncbi:MAG: hypothetical protein DRP09_19525 [Candidatus Thorarchaeota archaeon]|nr:MAG: hypothetical protein DRP09_19525 [Candidatus Thorarchaeota archaeon]